MTAEFQYIYILGVGSTTVPSSSGGGPPRSSRDSVDSSDVSKDSTCIGAGRCQMWSSSCFVRVQKPLQYLRSAAAGLEGSHSVTTKVVVVWARQVHRAHVAGFTPPGSATVGRPSVGAAFGKHQTSGWCENIVAIRRGWQRPAWSRRRRRHRRGPARSAALTARPPSAGGHPPAVSRIDG